MQNNSNPLVVRDFSIEQLLGRTSVDIDLTEISQFIGSKNILITGAAGSIGTELVRQVAQFKPNKIIFFDHNENNQFFLEKEIHETFPNITTVPRIGSVSNYDRAKTIFQETKPDIVFHAAANKHVPLCEQNPSEAIRNNVLGSHITADLAAEIKCEAFVLVSSDKAVKPSSVMGSTKRIAECYTQLLSKKHSQTRFITVRFGNVLGSSGSVVPIFKAQIASGGPITVTHPDMYRFFMTIPEAARLLLQSAVFAETGSIFVLDMGEPVKIIDLAKNMIKLSGFNPVMEQTNDEKDILIKFSGVRPGEKIYEELSFDYEQTEITKHPKIRNTKTPCPPENFLHRILILEHLAANTPLHILKKEINYLIPEATLKCNV